MTAQLDHVNGVAVTPRFDPIALAEAEAIRTKAEAEADAARIQAEAAAQVEIIRATEEAEKQRLANGRAARRDEADEAAHRVRMAELERKRAETQRLANAEAKAAEENEVAAEVEQEAREKSSASWKQAAIGFAVVCALVALPVQMSAFYTPERPYLGGVPIVLEAGAWVVLKGAAAAVTDRRPHWHYRLIAWLIAAGAAAVNLGHGLSSFDTVTAIATAVASIAGPGVWDLHEHGRIRARDGKKTWRQRWAAYRAAAKHAKQEAALQAKREATAEAEAAAAAADAAKLAADREASFEEVWKHAVKLAAALGETTVTQAIWIRAHKDIEGTDPGETVAIIRGRNAAERRLLAARSETPGEKPVKVTNAQRAIQVKAPRGASSYKPVPPRRTRNDTPKFHPVARALAAEAKRVANDAAAEEGRS
ncbi:hypothetical protein [Streptomyces virginiae]|uniref:hypothetical protein n=1 Tax=Streptomyces virginiae TaxID=1961 RepID=UPI00225BF505|nr:hypothetical protein [Streptomyces virginiae]MCX5176737.1 hypothetical protein [Streptomyces virginiae]